MQQVRGRFSSTSVKVTFKKENLCKSSLVMWNLRGMPFLNDIILNMEILILKGALNCQVLLIIVSELHHNLHRYKYSESKRIYYRLMKKNSLLSCLLFVWLFPLNVWMAFLRVVKSRIEYVSFFSYVYP